MDKPKPYLCLGLVRMFGLILCFVTGLKMYFFLNEKWQLGVTSFSSLKDLGGKGQAALFLAMLVSLVGLVIGQAIGGSIKVKSDNVAVFFTITWHYFANTTIYWVIASTILVYLSLGQSASVFFEIEPDVYFIFVAIWALIGGELIALSMFVNGKMIRNGFPLSMLMNRLTPIAIGGLMGYYQSIWFGLNPIIGIIAGVIIPFVLIPINAYMWRKDMAKRNPCYEYL